MFLVIQNKGEAPVESFTLLGASLSREDDSLIGQFGSGAKLAITTLLRKGLGVTIYTGKTRMEFKTKDIEIQSGEETKIERQVYVQYGGTSKRKQDLGWVLGFGELDWEDTSMAIREFVANAIDQTLKSGVSVQDAYVDRDLAVELISDKRAQKGYTRVFIEANEECEQYLRELNTRFLHFTNQEQKQFIPKQVPSPAKIYLEGVYVCTLENSADSIYDYNFRNNQIKIDESRNLNEYIARAAIGSLFKDAESKYIENIFNALKNRTKTLETELDPVYISNSYYTTDKCMATWQNAWHKVFGDSVACGSDQAVIGEMAARKGHTVEVVPSKWVEITENYGIKGVSDVLDKNEASGKKVTPPTFEAIDAVKEVWGWIEATGLQGSKECPRVEGFDDLSHGGSETFGFYTIGENTIHIRNDLQGQFLYEVVLEELAHYCTQAEDYSRDFQNFLTRIFVRWMK